MFWGEEDNRETKEILTEIWLHDLFFIFPTLLDLTSVL